MQLRLVSSCEDLPADAAALFPPEPFASLSWYRTVIADALPAGAAPRFAVLTQHNGPCAVAPLLRQPDGGLSSLTTPYTCSFRPLLTADDDPALVRQAGLCLGQLCRDWPTVRLDAVPAEWVGMAPLVAGLRQAGLLVQRFAHFGNWHEPVAGRSWAAYLADRPGALRETVRRKLKRCAKELRFELFQGDADLERGIAAFEAVYRASWKMPEPFPRFNAGLMRATAVTGTLRLGVLWVGDQPAAAQFWVVADGRATVLKLAHDETFKSFSPGTALTATMLRGLLDDDRISELDFGRGDDPYKAAWTTRRRGRVGLLLINPRRPAGLVAASRGVAGRVRERLRRAGSSAPAIERV